jgi:hypothetical protein
MVVGGGAERGLGGIYIYTLYRYIYREREIQIEREMQSERDRQIGEE